MAGIFHKYAVVPSEDMEDKVAVDLSLLSASNDWYEALVGSSKPDPEAWAVSGESSCAV
jgi:hypothetical protein